MGALRCVTRVKQKLLKEVLWESFTWLVTVQGQIQADCPEWTSVLPGGIPCGIPQGTQNSPRVENLLTFSPMYGSGWSKNMPRKGP